MVRSGLVILLLVLGINLSANEKDNEIRKLTKQIVTTVRNLPLTKSIEKNGVYSSQSKIHLRFDKNGDTFKIWFEDINPKTQKVEGKTIYNEIELENLHPEGVVLLRNDKTNTIGLRLFTANNETTIAKQIYFKERFIAKNYSDCVNIIQLDKYYASELTDLSDWFKRLIELKSSWPDTAIPQTDRITLVKTKKKKSEKNIQNSDDSEEQIFFNFSVTKPAYFLSADSRKANEAIIKAYLVNKLMENNLKFKGKFLAQVTIDKSGRIINVNSRKLTIEKNMKRQFQNF